VVSVYRQRDPCALCVCARGLHGVRSVALLLLTVCPLLQKGNEALLLRGTSLLDSRSTSCTRSTPRRRCCTRLVADANSIRSDESRSYELALEFLLRRVPFTLALSSATTVSRAVDFLPLDLTAVSRAADLVTSSRALHKIRQCTVTREAMRLDLSCSEGGIQPCWRVIQPCCFDRNLCLNPTDTSRIQPSKHTSA